MPSPTPTPTPIRLTPADAERYARLRRKMLAEVPWAFDAGPDDGEAPREDLYARMFTEDQHAVFAIESAHSWGLTPGRPELAAAAGLSRTRAPRFAHRARLWGVFVEAKYRGHGLGKAVVSSSIECARGWEGIDYLDLGVSENAAEALRLYERLGFKPWGREPEATAYGGRRYDEIYMTMKMKR
jgi:RimJ/RimL family protein N-acetyltransferase